MTLNSLGMMGTANQSTWCFGSNGGTVPWVEQIQLFLGISDLELDHSCLVFLFMAMKSEIPEWPADMSVASWRRLRKGSGNVKRQQKWVCCVLFHFVWLGEISIQSAVSRAGLLPAALPTVCGLSQSPPSLFLFFQNHFSWIPITSKHRCPTTRGHN